MSKPRPPAAVAETEAGAGTETGAAPDAGVEAAPPRGWTFYLALGAGGALILGVVVVLAYVIVSGPAPKAEVTWTPPPKPAPAPPPPPPSRSAPAPPQPAAPPKPAPKTASLPPMHPGEILVPFRVMDVGPIFFAADSPEQAKQREAEFRAAGLRTVAQWVDWFRERPAYLPTLAFLKKPFPKDLMVETFQGEAPATETDLLDPAAEPQAKGIAVTWHQYQGVGFAEDGEGRIIALRITAAVAPDAAPPRIE